MPHRRLAARIAALALLLPAAACDDHPFGPDVEAIDATYVLLRVNGDLVPTVIAEGGGERYIILADTLRFARSGEVTRAYAFRHISTTWTPADTVYHQQVVMPYTIEHGVVTIGWRDPCPPNALMLALCIGYEQGKIGPDRATIIGRHFWSGDPVLRFRRIGGR